MCVTLCDTLADFEPFVTFVDGAASRLSMLSINTYDEEDELSINNDLGRSLELETPDIDMEDSLL